MKKSDRDIMEILEAYDVALVGTVADHDPALDADDGLLRCPIRPQHPGALHDVLGLDVPEFLARVRTQLVRLPRPIPGHRRAGPADLRRHGIDTAETFDRRTPLRSLENIGMRDPALLRVDPGLGDVEVVEVRTDSSVRDR